MVGAGRMGKGLVRNWLRAGYEVMAIDTDGARAQEMSELGAITGEALPNAIARSQIVATCLPTLSAVDDVYYADDGIIANLRSGTHVLDFTSGSPPLTAQIAADCEAKGATFHDTPILRGEKEAWDGTIQLIVGGDETLLEKLEPVLSAVCEKWTHVGPTGHGHAFKAINNSVTLANHTALCEAFSVARSADLNLDLLYTVLDASQASSKKLHELGPKLIDDRHEVTMAVEPAAKDVSNFAALGDRLGVPTPVADAVYLLLRTATALGFGEQATSHLMTTLLKLAGPPAPGGRP